MEKKKYIKFIKNKREMGKIIIYLLIAIMLFFSMRTIAATILAGSESVIADEKTIVRTAASVSKGASSTNQVEIGSLTTELGRYASTTVTSLSSERIQVEFERTGNIYEIDVNHGPVFDIIEETLPYLPLGYTPVANTDLESGFVIQDENGNQFVWVEVPKTSTVYPTAGLEIKNFTSEEFDKIEADLHTYTSAYGADEYVDEWSTEAATGLSETEYNTLKKKMLKSIYKNGGFYVGRYETGIADSFRSYPGEITVEHTITETPVIQQHAYTYGYVTSAQAQELSSTFTTTGYTSNLLFGVQWDLILKYLEETGGTAQSDLKTNSGSWGNYIDTAYTITSSNAKYSPDFGTTYQSAPYERTGAEANGVLISSGATEQFKKQNIYDIAGNVQEWTLETKGSDKTAVVYRGASGANTGSGFPASYRVYNTTANINNMDMGFRVALYKDEGTYTPDENNQPPYIPDGYTAIDGTMEDGFVIADSLGNEYVWVEVPQTVAVYPTAGLSVTAFTEEEFEQIENDLQTYTSVYRNGTASTDIWLSTATSGLTQTEYNTQKKKMLKSIYLNGGFYVGRYETGIENSYRTSATTPSETPVIKQNAYPYNYVTIAQSQELSESFKTAGYETSLMFGVQWDLIMKYLETSGAAVETDLTTDSTSWGNYSNSTYEITNASAKYRANSTDGWQDEAYGEKASGASVLLSTGADTQFNKMGIYDLAGNVYELTLEQYTSNADTPCTFRGGSCNNSGSNLPASSRSGTSPTYSNYSLGFRVALYKDEGTSTYDAPTYIPYGYAHVAGTDMDTGFVVEDESGNQYVWVEVPKTSSVYKTAGTGIALFTDSEFEKIENDLHTYTSVYRNGTTYTDTWSSTMQTGLSESEYNIQKKKMLKSIYKNGGFYVGRYETGIDYNETARETDTEPITQTPVIKQYAYPYVYVTSAQAQELSSGFETAGYETSLMFGVQWDLVLKYLETSGAVTQTELTVDSTNVGNYKQSLFSLTDTNVKYQIDEGGTWNNAPYTKTEASRVFLSTGAIETYKHQNIYDLAGNVWDWTLERSTNTEKALAQRGGSAWHSPTDDTIGYRIANYRDDYGTYARSATDLGFRVSLYKDEGIGITAAYIPEGYTQVAGTDLDNGQVVQDAWGNEFVWVKVPRTTTVYPNAGLNIESFTDDEYEAIENDLQAYTSTYRVGSSAVSEFADEWFSYEHTGLTESEYYGLKKNMLKSVYINGGFYVGRYETGIATARTSASTALGTPLIKQNAYPYTYVTSAQAQTLASSFATGGYSTSLMFGLQWDLIMKYLSNEGVTEAELMTNSTSWGNYKSTTYNITNTSVKYSTDAGQNWNNAPYNKTDNRIVFLSTGSMEEFEKQNIYDLAGNMWEWTLETSTTVSTRSSIYRGSSVWIDGIEYEGEYQDATSRSYAAGATRSVADQGFRVSLFKDEGVSLKRNYDASNIDGNRATVTSATTIKDLAGNYDGTIYNSPTFGPGYISLNEGSSTNTQYIDMGPMTNLSKLTINLKFSVSETGIGHHLLGNWRSRWIWNEC